MVDRAGCDASKRAGVPVERIQVVSVTAETWPNSALGCPQPDGVHADVIMSGFRLVVRAGEQTYDYRIARSSDDGYYSIGLCPP